MSVSHSSDIDSCTCVMSVLCVFSISTQVDLTVQEKEKYLNVSRWFCHIQHCPGIRQHLSSVVFIKNRLYTNSQQKPPAPRPEEGVTHVQWEVCFRPEDGRELIRTHSLFVEVGRI